MSTTPDDTFMRQQEEVLATDQQFEQLFDKITGSFVKTAFIINGGAVIALTAFFSNSNSPDYRISLATCSFILGTTIGIFLFIIEFFISYFKVTTFRKTVFGHSINDNYLLNMIRHHQGYLKNYYQKQSTLTKIKIFTGITSIIFCFIGIFFIATFVAKNWCLISIATTILFFLFLGTLIWIYNMLKPKPVDENR